MTLYLEYLIWAVCDGDLHPVARARAQANLDAYLAEGTERLLTAVMGDDDE